MSSDTIKIFEEAEELFDQRRLVPAMEKLALIRQRTKAPHLRALALFNIGTIHWMRFGDGVAARCELLAAAEEFRSLDIGQSSQLQLSHASALENAMLCALSFDEFEALAKRLRGLSPEALILAGLIPVARELRERGEPWSHMLFAIAAPYYNRNDPKLDAGRYGEAKSTYHLMLSNRRALRLVREDWRMAMYEYCALAMRMAADCAKARGGDNDANSPEEFLPLLTEALSLVDEYLAVHSGDDRLKRTRDDMQRFITGLRERWASYSRNRAPVVLSRRFRCAQCHKPVLDPLQPCPACGHPSEIAVKVFTRAFVGALLCGGAVYQGLGGATPWWRMCAIGVAAFIGFAIVGSVTFHYLLRGTNNRSDHFDP